MPGQQRWGAGAASLAQPRAELPCARLALLWPPSKPPTRKNLVLVLCFPFLHCCLHLQQAVGFTEEALEGDTGIKPEVRPGFWGPALKQSAGVSEHSLFKQFLS